MINIRTDRVSECCLAPIIEEPTPYYFRYFPQMPWDDVPEPREWCDRCGRERPYEAIPVEEAE